MARHIFEIGSGRYRFDIKTLDSFIDEARNSPAAHQSVGAPGTGRSPDALSDQEVQVIFDEVMSLYNDYTRCQSVDLLVRLKCRLEEFSIRYKSHVLAAEVLNINSCLPYEQRIPRPRQQWKEAPSLTQNAVSMAGTSDCAGRK
jgi:hypothetical protein